MEMIIQYSLEFSIPAGMDTRKGTLPHIDKYLDTMEEVTQHLSRHFGFITMSTRNLKNISNGTFYYSIKNQIIKPPQMNLDSCFSPVRIAAWVKSSLIFLVANPEHSRLDDIFHSFAQSTGLAESFLYVPFKQTTIRKELDQLKIHTEALLVPPGISFD